MLALHNRRFTADEARAVALWAYDPPFDLYNLSEDEAVKLLTQRDVYGNGYYPAQEDGQVVGFVCFGPQARVRGQRKELGTCDVGRERTIMKTTVAPDHPDHTDADRWPSIAGRRLTCDPALAAPVPMGAWR